MWFVGRGRLGRGSAALAIDPARVAVAVMLFFPDGDAVLDFIDDVAAGKKRFVAMRCAHADPDCKLAQVESADAMDASSMLHTKVPDGRSDNALAFLEG